MLQQFLNPVNAETHRRNTAEELWVDAGGKIDVLVSGEGTGGTLTGIAEVLRLRNPNFYTAAVKPEDSPALSGGTAGPHLIQGIGFGFIPEILNTNIINEVLRIGNETSIAMARKVARLEGLPVGISSGAAIAATLEIGARREMIDKTIVAILPSFAERYLSTVLF